MPDMITSHDIKRELERKCRLAGGRKAWSRANGFSNNVATQVLRGTMLVSDRVAEALGFRRIPGWERVPDTSHQVLGPRPVHPNSTPAV